MAGNPSGETRVEPAQIGRLATAIRTNTQLRWAITIELFGGRCDI